MKIILSAEFSGIKQDGFQENFNRVLIFKLAALNLRQIIGCLQRWILKALCSLTYLNLMQVCFIPLTECIINTCALNLFSDETSLANFIIDRGQ